LDHLDHTADLAPTVAQDVHVDARLPIGAESAAPHGKRGAHPRLRRHGARAHHAPDQPASRVEEVGGCSPLDGEGVVAEAHANRGRAHARGDERGALPQRGVACVAEVGAYHYEDDGAEAGQREADHQDVP